TSHQDLWSHVALTFDSVGTTHKIYFNGSQAATTTDSTATTTDRTGLTIGTAAFLGSFLKAKLDEFRISNIFRGADWIATEYNNQVAPATFFSKGSEQTVSGDTLLGQIWM